MAPRWRAALPTVCMAVALLGAWEVVPRIGLLNPRFFPPFSAVMAALWGLLVDGVLLPELLVTLSRLAVAVVAAAVGGTVLGFATGLWRIPDVLSRSVIDAVYPMPKIALLPLVIIILGLGEQAFFIVAFATAFFFILIMTRNAVRAIDPLVLEAGRNYGATGWRLWIRVMVPATLPRSLTAVRLASGLCLISVIGVEFIAARTGVGAMVNRAWQTLSTEPMYTGLIIAGVLGHALNQGWLRLERVLVPWQAEASRDGREAPSGAGGASVGG